MKYLCFSDFYFLFLFIFFLKFCTEGADMNIKSNSGETPGDMGRPQGLGLIQIN